MLAHNRSGSYRFLAEEGRPFSNAVVADQGFDLVHAIFERPIPLADGLAAAARHVTGEGRTVHAIAGFELRIPESLTRENFVAFNKGYVSNLRSLGLQVDGFFPATRTNVAAVVGGVSEPSVYAVSYTRPGRGNRPAFVLSGAPEEEGGTSAVMLDSIMRVLSLRLEEIGCSWKETTAIQIYGVDNFQDLIVDAVLELAGPAAVHGIRWFPSLPPIQGLRLEIDARSSGVELVLPTSSL